MWEKKFSVILTPNESYCTKRYDFLKTLRLDCQLFSITYNKNQDELTKFRKSN